MGHRAPCRGADVHDLDGGTRRRAGVGMRCRGCALRPAAWSGALVAACAAGPNPDVAHTAQNAGFWLGPWHRLITPVTFVISLFTDDVNIYEVHTNGNCYDFLPRAGALGDLRRRSEVERRSRACDDQALGAGFRRRPGAGLQRPRRAAPRPATLVGPPASGRRSCRARSLGAPAPAATVLRRVSAACARPTRAAPHRWRARRATTA